MEPVLVIDVANTDEGSEVGFRGILESNRFKVTEQWNPLIFNL